MTGVTWWRAVGSVALLALLAWVGFEIGRAGTDVEVPRAVGPDTLTGGAIQGKRIDRREWSLDFDTLTMSPDGTQATIAHVRDGRLHRAGKPDVLMKADGVTINTVSNDLFITGPVSFREQIAPGRVRTFKSVGARYQGAARTLELDHAATITDGSATVTVQEAKVDFRTGQVDLGRIEGVKPGTKG